MLKIDSDFIWKRSMLVANNNNIKKYLSNITCVSLKKSGNNYIDWSIKTKDEKKSTIIPYSPFRITDRHKDRSEKILNIGQYNSAKLDTAPFELAINMRRARIGKYGRKNRLRGPYKPITENKIELADAFGDTPAKYEEITDAASFDYIDTNKLSKKQLRHHALHQFLKNCMVSYTKKYGFLFDPFSISLLNMTEEAMQIGWVSDYAHNLMVEPLQEFIAFRVDGYTSLERKKVKQIDAEAAVSKFIKQKLVLYNELSFSKFTMAPTARPKHLLGALWAILANHLEEKTIIHTCKDVFSPCGSVVNLSRNTRRTVCSNNCNNIYNHYATKDSHSQQLHNQWKKHRAWKQDSAEKRKSLKILK
ncbi:MAG: hypothetical protein DK305_000570 [Chloroflexi bacterium]|jgi:hypothetical protein|nr:MAG: hypothetical protein DK305_000570 [Chloroflexota bacterium]|tara:strand:+ start:1367 stop:2452 length:1086 start_codon:yes stop_codon:yes gene_type:complete